MFQVVPKESRIEAAINRDLSLTWSKRLPPGNRVVQGRWIGDLAPMYVSVEKELADSLAVAPGDKVTFNIAGRELVATVAGTRSVRWDTLTPNFFMILSPGSLDAYPHSWLTSFYLPAERKPVLARLAKRFPG